MTTRTQIIDVPDSESIPATIAVIGNAMRNAQSYFPLRDHAARLATAAPPHDFLGQVQAIYNDVVENWRYVQDPYDLEMVVTTGPEIMRYVLGIETDENGQIVNRTMGRSDCDDLAVYLGAALLSIGLPVRIVTSSEPGQPDQWSHVFVQADVPGHGWTTVDPVLYPMQGFGETVEAAKLGYWSLDGRMVHTHGLAGYLSRRLQLSGPVQATENEPVFTMAEINCCDDQIGTAIGAMGYIGNANDYEVELGPRDYVPDGSGRALTPVLAFEPDDFDWIATVGCPRIGMRAVGNTGYIYEFTEERPKLGGPIRRFFRRIGRGIANFFRRIWNGVKKIFQATKFGRWVLRVVDGVVGFATKILTPLAKAVGKLAPVLAPVAAMIPGVGPVISAYLISAGAVAELYQQWAVPVLKVWQVLENGESVELLIPQFENIEQVMNVKVDLLNAARGMPDITPEELENLESTLADVSSMTDADLAQLNEQMEKIGMDVNTGAEDYEPGVIDQAFEMIQQSQRETEEMSDTDKARIEMYMQNVNLADPFGEVISEKLPVVEAMAENAAANRAAYAASQAEQAAAWAMYQRAHSPEVRAKAEQAQAQAAAVYEQTLAAGEAAAMRAAAERRYREFEQVRDASLDALSEIGYTFALE